MTGMDWEALLRAGLRGLGLQPVQFWALTPVELSILLGLQGKDAPMNRDRLDALIASFPDIEKGKDDG